MIPLDLERLAVRIESLQREATHNWRPADQMELFRLLPDNNGLDTSQRLPEPKALRAEATHLRLNGESSVFTEQAYRETLTRCLRTESLVQANHPRRRLIRDMMQGRFPFRR